MKAGAPRRAGLGGITGQLPLRQPLFARLLGVLWAIDLLFIGGYVAFRIIAKLLHLDTIPDWLEVSSDAGIPEHLNMMKWAVAASALLIAGWQRRRLLYPALAAIILVLLADDGLQLHEQWGYWLDHHYRLLADLARGGLDLGELTYWTIVGVPLLAVTIVAALRATGRDRAFVVLILMLFLSLGLVGVLLDVVSTTIGHAITPDSFWSFLSAAIFLIEDGSEMLLISVLCASCVAVAAYWRDEARRA